MATVASLLKMIFGASTARVLTGQSDDLFDGLDGMEREEGPSGLTSAPAYVEATGRAGGASSVRKTVGPIMEQNAMNTNNQDRPNADGESNDDGGAHDENERLRAREERLRMSAPRPSWAGPRPRRWQVPER